MISLSVKYRPKTLDEITGQDSIVKILNQQINTGNIKNCYLFCGASGCGKTTAARAFSNAINNNIGTPIEIDGASNNGVDNVKQIVKTASERSIDGKYKIYIIDETHMLTTAAWNDFLKTIEEPPTYTIFIFCTTDPQKIPSTILNRVQRFNFNRITSERIKNRLLYICEQEGFINYNDACDYISRISNNQMRDAIATLEKCASYNIDLNMNNVLFAIGDYSYDSYFNLLNNLIDGNIQGMLESIEGFYNQGNDLKLFIDKFLSFCIDVNKYSLFNNCQLTQIPISMEDKLKYSTNFDNSSGYYYYLTNKLLELKNMIKGDNDIKSTIEVFLSRVCKYE